MIEQRDIISAYNRLIGILAKSSALCTFLLWYIILTSLNGICLLFCEGVLQVDLTVYTVSSNKYRECVILCTLIA